MGSSGNLAATLIYKPNATPAEAALRSFLAANALFEALAIYVGRDKLSLKWPNDVLLNGGKVAGILRLTGCRSASASTSPRFRPPLKARPFRPFRLWARGGKP
jgi:hypothetical protein